MNLDVETKRKLREMGCDRLVDAFCAQDDDLLAAVACAERVRLAVDDAYGMFLDDRVGGLVRRARLRYPNADLRSIEMVEERGLNRDVINQLSTCAWIGRHRNVVFQGYAGSGKTWLANAVARQACRNRIRTRYIRVPDLEEEWLVAGDKPQGRTKVLKRYASYALLVLDEWLFDRPNDQFRGFLFELMERRYDTCSTVFCTQYQQKDWHERLGGGPHADAIMDRIVHNTIWVGTGDYNMRRHHYHDNDDKE